jgi:hypothetical protein
MNSSSTALLAAAGAVAGAWLLERWADAPSATGIPATREEGGVDALNAAAARALPCGVQRLSGVETIWGTLIRTLQGGAGEDFIREFVIQRSSLTRALGDIGIPGLTDRPRLSARCALAWLELWLDAWQVANRANPRAFALDHGRIVFGGPLAPTTIAFDRAPEWRSAGSVSNPSSLGRAFEALRALRAHAAIETAGPLADVRPWIRAREVTEALLDFARELDSVAYSHDTSSEALDALRRDLHPMRFVEKAASVVVTPVEVALDKVVGPTVTAVVGTAVVSLAPILVIGGVVYMLVRKGAL